MTRLLGDYLIPGELSSPGTGSSSEKLGAGALAAGDNSAAFGNLASSAGVNSVAIGESSIAATDCTALGTLAAATGVLGVAIGKSALAIGIHSVCVGWQTRVAAGSNNGIAIGEEANVNHFGAISIGRQALTTAVQRMTIGRVGGDSSQLQQLQVSDGFAAFGVAPPSTQPLKITDPTDLASVIVAVNALIDVIEGTGLANAV